MECCGWAGIRASSSGGNRRRTQRSRSIHRHERWWANPRRSTTRCRRRLCAPWGPSCARREGRASMGSGGERTRLIAPPRRRSSSQKLWATGCSTFRSATKWICSAIIYATRRRGTRRHIWKSGCRLHGRWRRLCQKRDSGCRTGPSIQSPPHVTMLTHHYYFGGPATNPEVSIPNLLKPVTMARVQKTADTATSAADKMGVRVRMTEGNNCYRGGKPGVSDVFAAALWSADYALLLASNNYSGVNLHGGTGKSVANSVGGFLPGDVMLKDAGATPEQIASHPHPFYTPIATFGDHYTLEPVALGLKFASALCGATLVKVDLTSQIQATGIDATAYAAKLPGGAMTVVILNKDAERDLELTLDFGSGRSGGVELETLRAPAIDAREAHITRDANHGAVNQGWDAVTVPHAHGMRGSVL